MQAKKKLLFEDAVEFAKLLHEGYQLFIKKYLCSMFKII